MKWPLRKLNAALLIGPNFGRCGPSNNFASCSFDQKIWGKPNLKTYYGPFCGKGGICSNSSYLGIDLREFQSTEHWVVHRKSFTYSETLLVVTNLEKAKKMCLADQKCTLILKTMNDVFKLKNGMNIEQSQNDEIIWEKKV